MTHLLLFALALWCWGFTTTAARAFGADHPKGPVAGNDQWPEGLKELVNRSDRVHGYWVNETDVFFYHGDSQKFNQFIDGYRKLKNTTLRVVIHAGTKKARSPWDKADRDILVAWSLHASCSPLAGVGVPKAGDRFYTRVDVWLGSPVKLEELRIPPTIEVISGREIEKFIAERQGQPPN
jgi:hypothetical protein